MKKVFLLAGAFIFASILTTFAKQITPEQSRLVAEEVLSSSATLRNNSSDLELVQTVYDKSGDLRSETVLYYVYKITEDKGFVIVSGDDCFYPVIGYSLENRYETDNVPPNFRLWMDDVESGISKAIRENKQATERTAKAWDAYLNDDTHSLRSSQAVGALIETKWDQGEPFNKNCVFSGTTTSAGCIATVMAQIMNYYKYPRTGTNAIPAYITKTQKYHVSGIPVSEMTYNWSILRNIYSYDATGASIEEVNKLMFHCAVSVETDFDPESSNANTKNAAVALANYFGYDQGTHYKSRIYYSDDEWKAILKAELDRLHPIIYTGQRSTGSGHGFICDGYDDKDLFHFNFGWTGAHDGFYTIDGIQFPYYNTAIIGIQPDTGENNNVPSEVVIGPNQGSYIFRDISSATTEISQNEDFSVNGSFWNIGIGTFTGSIGYVLLNTDYTFVENIGSSSQTLIPGQLTGLRGITCNVSDNVPEGNYIIKPAILSSDGNIWQIVRAETGFVGELPLFIKQKIPTIPVTNVSLNRTEKKLLAGEEFQLTASIFPADASNTNLRWTSSDQSVATVSSTGLVKTFSEGNATISTITEDGGKTASCALTVKLSYANIDQSQPKITVYVNTGELYINTPFAETISIYSLVGSRIHHFDKPVGEWIINTGNTSKTLWIVKGSSGWIRKILL